MNTTCSIACAEFERRSLVMSHCFCISVEDAQNALREYLKHTTKSIYAVSLTDVYREYKNGILHESR